MLRCPSVKIVYVYPSGGGQGFPDKAYQFVDSYERHPPGLDHETVIVCNGKPAGQAEQNVFGSLPGVQFLNQDNSGWDIGGFQLAARTVPCDLMVFFGAHTYFRRAGWLARMFEAWAQYGDTLYGATGNQGNIAVGVYPHVRTTAFWCSPALMNEYPYRVTSTGGGGQRYAAEHGKSCISNFVREQGLTPMIVTFQGIAPLQSCDSLPGGYHNGNQEHLLVGDRLTTFPFTQSP